MRKLLSADKFDSSKSPKKAGRPKKEKELAPFTYTRTVPVRRCCIPRRRVPKVTRIGCGYRRAIFTGVAAENLVVRIAKENDTWGYDRIAGAVTNLGYKIADETVGNILRRHGVAPVRGRHRGMPWSEFIEQHQDVLLGCDFFTAEVFTPVGLITYYVLFFIKIGTREVHIAGITPSPGEAWMKQVARNLTMVDLGFLDGCRYVLMDRDKKFCRSFRAILRSSGIKPLRLPAMSPNLNAYSERWVLTDFSECLSKLVLFGEQSVRRAPSEFVDHYHFERNHQGLENVIPFQKDTNDSGPIRRRDRLGGMLKFYYRSVA